MPLFDFGRFRKKKQPQVPRDNMTVMELLHEAKTADDPAYAHACLQRAEILAPDSIDVQRALLMLGRLYLREQHPGQYDVIKSYLLHSFEHPEKYSEEEGRRMARELFDDKRLQTCLELSENKEAFLEAYLSELCEDYVRLFIMGDSSHAPRVFGLSIRHQLGNYLARPAFEVIKNALQSPYLDAREQRLLARCFYQAYQRQMKGDTKTLDKLLGPQMSSGIA